MRNQVVLHIRNPLLLDASTYVSTAVMGLLGLSGLHTLAQQALALALCLAFVLLYRFLFRTGVYERNPPIYFSLQAGVLLLLLFLRSDAGDAFNFLFYILTVHATVVLQLRRAVAWVALYFVLASAVGLLDRGWEGLYAVFFYLAAFTICGIFGHTVQLTELTSERNERLVTELQQTQQKLQELAVLEERNRLARDLHDSVKQQVFAISMQLSAARTALPQTDPAYSSVVEAERLAQQAGAELTGLIQQLRPPAMENKSLREALQEHVREWTRQTGIPVQLRVDDALPLTFIEEQAFFRVVQEALANIARHSQATQVGLELRYTDSDVLFCISDNGKGFEVTAASLGIGLHSMQERLAQLGADFQIQSSPEQGTQITARLRRAA